MSGLDEYDIEIKNMDLDTVAKSFIQQVREPSLFGYPGELDEHVLTASTAHRRIGPSNSILMHPKLWLRSAIVRLGSGFTHSTDPG